VAHMHGGTLRLQDNAPGLRAVLVLPLALPEREAHAMAPSPAPGTTVPA